MKMLLVLFLLVQASTSDRINGVIGLLDQRKVVFGMLAQDHSNIAAQAAADSAIDFVFVDMEHNPLNFERLQNYFNAMLFRGSQLRVAPMVRLPANGAEQNQYMIKQALDLGAMGLMIPMTETREDVLAIVRASRYAQSRGAPDFEPAGFRGAFPNKAARYWAIPPDEYVRRADLWPLDRRGEILLTIQIETEMAVRNIDEILSVPGVGVAFIGPGDLSISIGVEGAEGQRLLEESIQRVLDACKRHNVVSGIFVGADNVEQRVNQGFQFIVFGEDSGLGAGASDALSRGRAVAGRN